MTDLNRLRLVLNRIAVSHAVDPECLSVDDEGAVFYRNGDELLCLCQRGSHYWIEIESEIVAVQLIQRAARW
jgi:hypothetical protein